MHYLTSVPHHLFVTLVRPLGNNCHTSIQILLGIIPSCWGRGSFPPSIHMSPLFPFLSIFLPLPSLVFRMSIRIFYAIWCIFETIFLPMIEHFGEQKIALKLSYPKLVHMYKDVIKKLRWIFSNRFALAEARDQRIVECSSINESCNANYWVGHFLLCPTQPKYWVGHVPPVPPGIAAHAWRIASASIVHRPHLPNFTFGPHW
jgi:hypothetical protein